MRIASQMGDAYFPLPVRTTRPIGYGRRAELFWNRHRWGNFATRNPDAHPLNKPRVAIFL